MAAAEPRGVGGGLADACRGVWQVLSRATARPAACRGVVMQGLGFDIPVAPRGVAGTLPAAAAAILGVAGVPAAPCRVLGFLRVPPLRLRAVRGVAGSAPPRGVPLGRVCLGVLAKMALPAAHTALRRTKTACTNG